MPLFQDVQQAYAQARPPLVPPGGGPRYVPRKFKAKEGYGPMGQAVGEAAGGVFEYFIRTPERMRKEAEQLREQVFGIGSDRPMPREMRTRLLSQPQVQQKVKTYQKHHPGLFVDMSITTGDPQYEGMIDFADVVQPEAVQQATISQEDIKKGKEPIRTTERKADVRYQEAASTAIEQATDIEAKLAPIKQALQEGDLEKLKTELKYYEQGVKEDLRARIAGTELTQAQTAETRRATGEAQRTEPYRTGKIISETNLDYAQADWYRRKAEEISWQISQSTDEKETDAIKQLHDDRIQRWKTRQEQFKYIGPVGSPEFVVADTGDSMAMVLGLGVNAVPIEDANGVKGYVQVPNAARDPHTMNWVVSSFVEARKTAQANAWAADPTTFRQMHQELLSLYNATYGYMQTPLVKTLMGEAMDPQDVQEADATLALVEWIGYRDDYQADPNGVLQGGVTKGQRLLALEKTVQYRFGIPVGREESTWYKPWRWDVTGTGPLMGGPKGRGYKQFPEGAEGAEGEEPLLRGNELRR